MITDEIKDYIGQLSVAVAKSTEPANKISLTSSRISIVLAAMQEKCREKMPKGLFEILNLTLIQMLQGMKEDDMYAMVTDRIEELQKTLIEYMNSHQSNKAYLKDALQVLTDFNQVVQCRDRWKMASRDYMSSAEAWARSNEMLADIHDVLSRIEIAYGLIAIPKNVSFDIDMANYTKPQQGGETQPQAGEPVNE